MTSPREIHPEPEPIDARDAELVQRALDDELGPEERAALADRLDRDPGLRAELDRQRRLTETLRHAIPFGPEDAGAPSPAAVLEGVFDAPAPPKPFPFRRLAIYAGAIAAALVLAVTVRTAVMQHSRSIAPLDPDTLDPARLYLRATRDFEPDIVCDTPEKFIEYTAEHLGPRLTANFDTPVALVGWSKPRGAYGIKIPDGPDADPARILLATVPGAAPSADHGAAIHDAPDVGPGADPETDPEADPETDPEAPIVGPTRVIVIFHEADRPLTPPHDASGLNTFARTFGDLIATEVTPLDRPVVLDLVSPAG